MNQHVRLHTGNCAPIDCTCGGESTPAEARNSSSVLMVPRERLICAASTMVDCRERVDDE